ncbi:hypothetical protein [Planococcus faecalis]|uniref:hypothetical protein n=1 Tax=Planococcus faecalis TaxID=1598147 RepID=UPI0008DA3F86|nr:hypothetical protein [Planococcus faecalis]OHX54037.1 hypothetical protein BB777_07295 [Planococcus faecalis]
MNGFGKFITALLIFAGILSVFFGGMLHILNTGDVHLFAFFGAIIISLVIFLFLLQKKEVEKNNYVDFFVFNGRAAFAVPHYYKESLRK